MLHDIYYELQLISYEVQRSCYLLPRVSYWYFSSRVQTRRAINGSPACVYAIIFMGNFSTMALCPRGGWDVLAASQTAHKPLSRRWRVNT